MDGRALKGVGTSALGCVLILMAHATAQASIELQADPDLVLAAVPG